MTPPVPEPPCSRRQHLLYLLSQIICTVKIRRAPTRHDNIDFQPLVIRTSEVLPISVTVADKGYDSEDNHVLIREHLYAFCIIPARYEHVPIFRTHGKYRKQTDEAWLLQNIVPSKK